MPNAGEGGTGANEIDLEDGDAAGTGADAAPDGVEARGTEVARAAAARAPRAALICGDCGRRLWDSATRLMMSDCIIKRLSASCASSESRGHKGELPLPLALPEAPPAARALDRTGEAEAAPPARTTAERLRDEFTLATALSRSAPLDLAVATVGVRRLPFPTAEAISESSFDGLVARGCLSELLPPACDGLPPKGRGLPPWGPLDRCVCALGKSSSWPALPSCLWEVGLFLAAAGACRGGGEADAERRSAVACPGTAPCCDFC